MHTLSKLLTPAEWLLNHEKTTIIISYGLSVLLWYVFVGFGILGSLFFGLFTVHFVGMALLIPIGFLQALKQCLTLLALNSAHKPYFACLSADWLRPPTPKTRPPSLLPSH